MGYRGGIFGPDNDLTRAMMVQILYNREGHPAVDAGSPYEDVDADTWFADAINWATANNIVESYGDGNFGPDDLITREQLATILYRYSQYKGYDVSKYENTSIHNYTDTSDVSQ